jgi:hypothetical protein
MARMQGSETPGGDREDLSSILGNIGWGRLAETRAKLANTAETRDLLEIGLLLLREDLLGHTGPDFDQRERSRLFESLSRKRIAEKAIELDPQNELILSEHVFRHRWDRKDRYTEDLISYLFRLTPQQQRLQEMEKAALKAVSAVTLKELVQLLAAAEVDMVLVDPIFNLQNIIQAALPIHPKVRQFSKKQYDMLLTGWASLYERIALAYGLRLKPGFTWSDVALLFNAVVEGTLLRARVYGEEAVLSNGERLLARAIGIMLPSLVEGLPDDWSTQSVTQNPSA